MYHMRLAGKEKHNGSSIDRQLLERAMSWESHGAVCRYVCNSTAGYSIQQLSHCAYCKAANAKTEVRQRFAPPVHACNLQGKIADHNVMLHMWLRMAPPRAVTQPCGRDDPKEACGHTAKVRGFAMLEDPRNSVPLQGGALQMMQSIVLDDFNNHVYLRYDKHLPDCCIVLHLDSARVNMKPEELCGTFLKQPSTRRPILPWYLIIIIIIIINIIIFNNNNNNNNDNDDDDDNNKISQSEHCKTRQVVCPRLLYMPA
jgi:hypothetical protein